MSRIGPATERAGHPAPYESPERLAWSDLKKRLLLIPAAMILLSAPVSAGVQPNHLDWTFTYHVGQVEIEEANGFHHIRHGGAGLDESPEHVGAPQLPVFVHWFALTQVAELHDGFTIAAIMAYEDLGFCRNGKGGRFIAERQPHTGGKVAVNVDGGLKAKDHPIGATGVSMTVEIARQVEVHERSWPPRVGIPMVLVPAGTFTMGDSYERFCEDDHEVTLTRDFHLGWREVTNQEFVEALQWAYEWGHVRVTPTSVRDRLDGCTAELLELGSRHCEIEFDGGFFRLKDAGHGIRPEAPAHEAT